MNKMVYFTLGEVIAEDYPSIEPNTSNDLSFTTLMTLYGLVYEDASSTTNDIINQLMRMVYARFYDLDIFRKKISYYANEDTATPSTNERKNIYKRMIGIFNLTSPRYLVLLKQFKEKSNDPIGKISSKSSGTTRFNDTPQDEGTFEDDEHTTNITESVAETESDTGSIMERLDSLYKNWRSVLRDWTNEFRGLFYIGGK